MCEKSGVRHCAGLGRVRGQRYWGYSGLQQTSRPGTECPLARRIRGDRPSEGSFTRPRAPAPTRGVEVALHSARPRRPAFHPVSRRAPPPLAPHFRQATRLSGRVAERPRITRTKKGQGKACTNAYL